MKGAVQVAETQVEELKKEDIKECYELCKLCFNEAYGLEEVTSLFDELKEDKKYRFIVAKLEGKIVGYVSIVMAYNLFDGKRPFMELWWVCTHPEYRRKKIMTKLFEEIDRIAKENNCELIYFTTGMENTGAQAFYEKMGYNGASDKAYIKMLEE